MARPRTPTNVLELRGAFKKDPQRKRPNEPKPAKPVGTPPRHERFTPEHQAIWRELKRQAADGVLTISDRIALEALCYLIAELRGEPSRFSAAKYSRMEALLGKIGFTPADRSKVNVPGKPKGNAFSDF